MIRHGSKPRFRVSILRSRWSSKSRTSTRGFRVVWGVARLWRTESRKGPRAVYSKDAGVLRRANNVVTDARVGMTLTAFRGLRKRGRPSREKEPGMGIRAFPMATYSRVIQYSANPNNDPKPRFALRTCTRINCGKRFDTDDAQVAVYAVDAPWLDGPIARRCGRPGCQQSRDARWRRRVCAEPPACQRGTAKRRRPR